MAALRNLLEVLDKSTGATLVSLLKLHGACRRLDKQASASFANGLALAGIVLAVAVFVGSFVPFWLLTSSSIAVGWAVMLMTVPAGKTACTLIGGGALLPVVLFCPLRAAASGAVCAAIVGAKQMAAARLGARAAAAGTPETAAAVAADGAVFRVRQWWGMLPAPEIRNTALD